MRTSDIIPGHDYAVKTPNGLRSFRVDAIVTRRTRITSSPRDYDVKVEGYFMLDNKLELETELKSLKTDVLLGPYASYSELAARREKLEAERKLQLEAERQAATRLADTILLILNKTAATAANPKHIEASHGTVYIYSPAVQPLLTAMHRLGVHKALDAGVEL